MFTKGNTLISSYAPFRKKENVKSQQKMGGGFVLCEKPTRNGRWFYFMKQKMSKAVTCLLSPHLLRRGPRVVGRWLAFFS